MQLPELVELVIEELAAQDPQSLILVTCVNSLWADVATSVHWRQAPLAALAAVPPARRYRYTSKMRALSLDSLSSLRSYTECVSGADAGLCLPQVRQLAVNLVWVPHGVAASVVRQFASPRLTHFGFCGDGSDSGQLLSDALARLRAPVSQLRQLRLQTLFDEPDQAALRDFLAAGVPLLRSLTLRRQSARLLSPIWPALLVQIARCPGLRELLIDKEVHRTAVAAAAASVVPPRLPFAVLQCLDICVASYAVPSLASMTRGLRHLTLVLRDGDGADCSAVMPALAPLRSLHTLLLVFPKRAVLHRESLLGLCSLTSLRRLKLCASSKWLTIFELTDSDMSQLVSAIGHNLLELNIPFRSPFLTSATLRAIGENCPAIVKLKMFVAFDLQQLGTDGPRLFSALTTLWIDTALTTDYATQV
jgi:hypothetical protein